MAFGFSARVFFFILVLVASAVLREAVADNYTDVLALQLMNAAREERNLTFLKLDDQLCSVATKCAEYFGYKRKLGNCPYYDKQKTAYLSYTTSSRNDTQEELLDNAYEVWKQRGTIRSGMSDWFTKFGVGFALARSGHFVVALMS